MLVSELSFPHLQAAREARLTRELEQRRVAHERLTAERRSGGAARRGARWHAVLLMPRRASQAVDPCAGRPTPV